MPLLVYCVKKIPMAGDIYRGKTETNAATGQNTAKMPGKRSGRISPH